MFKTILDYFPFCNTWAAFIVCLLLLVNIYCRKSILSLFYMYCIEKYVILLLFFLFPRACLFCNTLCKPLVIGEFLSAGGKINKLAGKARVLFRSIFTTVPRRLVVDKENWLGGLLRLPAPQLYNCLNHFDMKCRELTEIWHYPSPGIVEKLWDARFWRRRRCRFWSSGL
jgi:hypothetical protein